MPAIIRFRIIAEHYSPELHHPCDGLFVSRTTVSNKLASYFIGAGIQFHYEYHLIPSIPHHNPRTCTPCWMSGDITARHQSGEAGGSPAVMCTSGIV
jgi:hypothetical protein